MQWFRRSNDPDGTDDLDPVGRLSHAPETLPLPDPLDARLATGRFVENGIEEIVTPAGVVIGAVRPRTMQAQGDDGVTHFPADMVLGATFSKASRWAEAYVKRISVSADSGTGAQKWGLEVAAHQTLIDEINEALTAAGLPGRFPELLGCWRVDGTDPEACLATRLLPGRTIRDLLADHPDGLPVDLAVEIIVQTFEMLGVMHSRGICRGDHSGPNVIVYIDNTGTVVVHFVDAGHVDFLATTDPVERAAWAPCVDPQWQYRLDGPRYSLERIYNERVNTASDLATVEGLDTDLGKGGLLALMCLTGSHEPHRADIPDNVPYPLACLVARMAHTGEVATARARGKAGALTDGLSTARLVRLLAPAVDDRDYLKRLRPEMPAFDRPVADDVVAWAADDARTFDVRTAAVRFLLDRPVDDNDNPHLRAVRILHDIVTGLDDPADVYDLLEAEGIAGDDVAALAAAAHRELHADLLAVLADGYDTVAPAVADAPDPHEGQFLFGTSEWMSAVAALARRSGSRGTPRNGRWGLNVRDGDWTFGSFTLVVVGNRPVTVREGVGDAAVVADVDVYDLADLAEGTARLLSKARGKDKSVEAFAEALPEADLVELCTVPSSRPQYRADDSKVTVATPAWWSRLVERSRRETTSPDEHHGRAVVIDLVDRPSPPVRIRFGGDGRPQSWEDAPEGHRVLRIRADRFVGLLSGAADAENPAERRLAPLFCDPSTWTDVPGVAEFWTAGWADAWSYRAPLLPVEVSRSWGLAAGEGGAVLLVDPSGRGPVLTTGDGPPPAKVWTVSPERLWDVLVEGRSWPGMATPPPPVALLTATRPPDPGRFTQPSQSLGVPADRRSERDRQRQARRGLADRLAPLPDLDELMPLPDPASLFATLDDDVA